MRYFYKENFLSHNIIFTISFSTLLIGFDFIVNYFFTNYYIISSKFTLQEIIITLVISFWISYLNSGFKKFITFIFLAFILIEINYFIFFRGYLQPYQLGLLFSEFSDIFDSLKSIIIQTSIVLSVFIVVYFVIIKNLIKNLYPRKSYFADISFVVFLILLIVVANTKPNKMKISPLNFSYINMIYTVSLSTQNIFKSNNTNKFNDYNITKLDNKTQNIIVIMGESLSYTKMDLFGYDSNNTNLLDKFKTNKNFLYSKAISCGVNTPVSIATFFNLKREPTNTKVILSNKTNLLKLARDNKYDVYWLSMQEEGMSISSVLQYANHIKTRQDFPAKAFDEDLIGELKNIDFTKNNFIVLHLRADHSPYEEYIPSRFRSKTYDRSNYHQYKLKSYIDSVKYVDFVVSNIFKFMDKTNQPFKVYFTSDHAEMFGSKKEQGRYGHSVLDIEAARVPFLYYSSKPVDINITKTNHYKIGKLILNDLGYDLKNPNQKKDIFYLNGVKLDGSAGFLEYNLSKVIP